MDNPRFRTVLIELGRRGVALVLFVAAATAGLGYGRADLALVAVVLGALAYVLPPRPRIPDGAVHHERMPTVYMPDLLGFMLATTFFALPLIVSAQEPWRNGPWGLFLFTGIPGLIALLIFWIAIRHQCLWLRVTGHDLTIADLDRIVTLSFSDIVKVKAEVKQPPRWLEPLLIAFGGLRGLAIALLTAERPSHALVVVQPDGTERRIPTDAFPDMRAVLAALRHGNVPLDPPLQAIAGKSDRHRLHTSKPRKSGRNGHERRA